MKKFFCVKKIGPTKRNGSRTETISIYKFLPKGKGRDFTEYIGDVAYESASNRGDISEIVRYLVEKKVLPKTLLTPNGYAVNYDIREKKGVFIQIVNV